ncbi:MAG TPA: DUF805 domain-containing protein [Oxalicibacterium sp.]|nr:DUF805 domain-containing protein [Oxalicibacterium sp.]
MTPDIDKLTLPSQKPARLLSLRGRIGRAHYIANTLGALVASFFLIWMITFLLIQLGELGRTLYVIVCVLLFYCALPIFFTILTIKRAHDFNVGGWLALLLLVPVLTLAFWFIPGSKDDNHYGPTPPAPSLGIKVVAVLFPLLLIGGFLATGIQFSGRAEQPSSSQPATTTLRTYTP